MNIKTTKTWSSWDVRNMCVRENFYTCGNNEDYSKMLDYVNEHKNPEDMDIYIVAKDILKHTDENLCQTMENIMFILANDVVKYFYNIELEK